MFKLTPSLLLEINRETESMMLAFHVQPQEMNPYNVRTLPVDVHKELCEAIVRNAVDNYTRNATGLLRYKSEWDNRVRELYGMRKPAVLALWRERHPHIWTSHPPERYTKEELISDILRKEFPHVEND